jgi:hypothetical protein
VRCVERSCSQEMISIDVGGCLLNIISGGIVLLTEDVGSTMRDVFNRYILSSEGGGFCVISAHWFLSLSLITSFDEPFIIISYTKGAHKQRHTLRGYGFGLKHTLFSLEEL